MILFESVWSKLKILSLFVGIFIMASLIGCHITYIVRVNGVDLTGRMDLPCGYGQVFLKGRGKRYFSFWQIYNLKGEAKYHPSALKVYINDMSLEVETYKQSDNTDLLDNDFMVFDGDTIISEFFVPEGVFEQDTIIVKTSNLLECNDNLSDESWFYYYFNRNEFIRIR